jgi:prepilin-type N-terminal cleavage/methylation domain-containing protein
MKAGDCMQPRDPDRGFSLVEMVLAIFLLGLLAMATLPLLIATTKNSVINRDINTATSYANAVIVEIRSEYPDGALATSCAGLKSVADAAAEQTSAQQFTATVTLNASCSSIATDYPFAMPITVSVHSPASGATTSITSQIFVGAP